MLSLAQDLLTAGIALAAYVAGALLAFGRCRRLAPPAQPFFLALQRQQARHALAAPGR